MSSPAASSLQTRVFGGRGASTNLSGFLLFLLILFRIGDVAYMFFSGEVLGRVLNFPVTSIPILNLAEVVAVWRVATTYMDVKAKVEGKRVNGRQLTLDLTFKQYAAAYWKRMLIRLLTLGFSEPVGSLSCTLCACRSTPPRWVMEYLACQTAFTRFLDSRTCFMDELTTIRQERENRVALAEARYGKSCAGVRHLAELEACWSKRRIVFHQAGPNTCVSICWLITVLLTFGLAAPWMTIKLYRSTAHAMFFDGKKVALGDVRESGTKLLFLYVTGLLLWPFEPCLKPGGYDDLMNSFVTVSEVTGKQQQQQKQTAAVAMEESDGVSAIAGLSANADQVYIATDSISTINSGGGSAVAAPAYR